MADSTIVGVQQQRLSKRKVVGVPNVVKRLLRRLATQLQLPHHCQNKNSDSHTAWELLLLLLLPTSAHHGHMAKFNNVMVVVVACHPSLSLSNLQTS